MRVLEGSLLFGELILCLQIRTSFLSLPANKKLDLTGTFRPSQWENTKNEHYQKRGVRENYFTKGRK